MVRLRDERRVALPGDPPTAENHLEPGLSARAESPSNRPGPGDRGSRGTARDATPGRLVRVIVAGTRGWDDRKRFHQELLAYLRRRHLDHVVRFISGDASSGADRLIVQWCDVYPYRCDRYPADWDQYGKRAGYIRNAQMAEVGDELLAYWDGLSKGTEHMIGLMHRLGKHYEVVHY